MKIVLLACLIYFNLHVNAQESGPAMYTQKIEKIFNGLNKDTMHLVDEFYQTNAHFEDPMGKHMGVEEIRKYYMNLYQNVENIRFDFSNHICQSQECVSVWVMHLKASGLNGGNSIAVSGNSIFKFDESGKVIYHRDYFDMGEFIYERIPILKNIILFIKSKLKG